LHEIPPSNFETGATSSSITEELIRLVHETVPDKPIRYVILSHFHGDHAGGVRAFIAEGATVITTSETTDLLTKAARRPHRIGRDRLTGRNIDPKFLLVDGRRSITDGERLIEIIEIEGNPHAEGLLALWLPLEKFLFVADVFHATRLERYPMPSERPLQEAFVRWLDATRLQPERIYGVHGGVGTPEHLQKVRETMARENQQR
ncbi:MAG TPA: MBL fold metallo-hydrolase, partial [Thermoanaerobaculia bacterium]|nr:MBL fold metallo-hydrolase [Thermoanaerobaculia bacterium]